MKQTDDRRNLSCNVEIKARAGAFEDQLRLAEEINDAGPERLDQCDRYFRVDRGRLKLREIRNRHAELIYYERADTNGPRESRYLIAPVEDPIQSCMLLDAALGTKAVVRKVRTLLWVGQTRIHFDRVEGLGEFIELEVVLHAGQSVGEGEVIARELMRRLQIDEDHLVAQSYLDLSER